ncbi:MAG: SPOR domain-containing protein [Candidatus Omnitrophota bacterium]
MSYKNTEVQPELFNGITKKQRQKAFRRNAFSINYKSAITVSVDTLIVIALTLVMVNLLCFVVGMEKGKQFAKLQDNEAIIKVVPEKIQAKQNIITKNQEPETNEEIKKDKLEHDVVVKPVETAPNSSNQGYAIQLASYNKNGIAEKEAQLLKQKGFESFVLKKGDFYVVYTGVYLEKTTAIKNLDNFKKRYKDCFVRFLEKS